MKAIKFKSNIWPLILGIALIILLIPLLCVFMSFFFDPEFELIGKIIAVIVGGMFVVLPVICGILAIKSYFDNGKRLREGLAKYDKENLLKNIQDNTISVYKNKVYFTDKLIIDPGQAIIDYNEISLMYKHVSKSRYGAVASIDFELLDGSSWFLCSGIEDQQIHEYMQLCYQHNPKIMFGYTKENLERHKERVTRERTIAYYSEKSGMSLREAAMEGNETFAQRQSDERVLEMPKQWTPEGQQYDRGKRMYHIGFIGLVIMILTFVPVSLIIMTQGPLLVNEVVTFIFLFMVFLPAFLFCILLGIFGKKKMKKYENAMKGEK